MPTIKRNDFDRLVRDFKFSELFNELGWNNTSFNRNIKIEDQNYPLTSIAEKNGFFVMHCEAMEMPSLPVRRQIDSVFTKVKDFHLIIYTDQAQREQRWQFVLRAPNRPPKNIEVGWKKGQDTEVLWQRTQGLFFALDEEDNITIVDVTSRVTDAFSANAEKVTKKFYETFTKEHSQFLDFIQGIGTQVDKEWYASLMLNRLMFCYFIQKKGFLDNNTNYLSDKLAETKKQEGGNRFYSFYRDFLLLLFHQGLNEPNQSPETRAEIGQIPYLNGGLFDVHELEATYAGIDIPDEAFERIFKFFDQWEWHLDTRANASAREINPDVIGFIFEKYINDRADMGAYYTKEDITDYISKNCIIPFLCDQTERNGGRLQACWDLAKQSGDQYIFPSVRHGVSLALPPEIEDGLDTTRPDLVARRKVWNREAPPEYGLPTEWWREVVERRKRHDELRQKIDSGAIQSINEFITLNLDIRRFAQDVLQKTEDPDFIWAFFRALSSVSVLDPTCGSGAFLFAALNILEPLYEACLDRMAAFVEAGQSRHSKNFEHILAESADTTRHPSREYYIHKKIIVQNLYGVDIMREAVEIAKLRLFLKLMSTVQPDRRKPNLGLEPLPDVDFNLRSGNSLVGFATLDEAIEAINQRDLPAGAQGRLVFGEELEVINAVKEKAELIGMAYKRFKDGQTMLPDGAGLKKAKGELTRRLRDLSATLDEYLAFQYGVDAQKNKKRFQQWKISHQPFHWWSEFYEVLYDEEDKFKGFDVVIGNPPYVEYSEVKKTYSLFGFKTIECGNLFALIAERSCKIAFRESSIGMIVPISAVSTPRMQKLHEIIWAESDNSYISNYAVRPGKLFDGVDMNLTIFIVQKNRKSHKSYSSNYSRWYTEERDSLFHRICYQEIKDFRYAASIPKIKNNFEFNLFKKIQKDKFLISVNDRTSTIYYHSGGRYFRKCLLDQLSNEYKPLLVPIKTEKKFIALLSSSFYYWFWLVTSDTYHVTKRDVESFPISNSLMMDDNLNDLGNNLLTDIWRNSKEISRNRKDGSQRNEINFFIGKSKPIIDEIDTVLAEHYGFTEEELDFIINYDIKYRMGRGSGEED